MQLAVHEAQDLSELTMSCVNTITNMACFIDQAKDAELKGLLQKHFPLHLRDYNIKVEFLSQVEGASLDLPVSGLNPFLQSFISPVTSPRPVTPRTSVQQFNDREIATAYLLTLKRAGREYAWATMEMSNPEIRSFLEKAFQMSSHHAYEIWQWMVQKGYYPLEAAATTTQVTLGNFYNKVQEPASIMQ